MWTRLWVGKAASGEEAPWQSGIDFQKMVRELVESADSANEGEKPGPETVAEAVVDLAKMSGRLTDWTVLVMRSHLALERRVRWLERCVIVIGTLVLFFLGMIFAALLRSLRTALPSGSPLRWRRDSPSLRGLRSAGREGRVRYR